MSAAPAVSVVMPVYNTGAYVGPAIESILNQSLRELELIVADDGSDEETLAILRRHDGADPRLHIHFRPHAGLSPTRNFAVSQAQAPLVANLDSDDIALPQRLETQLAYMNAHPQCAVSGGHARQIDPEGLELGPLKVRTMHEQILEQLHWGRGSAINHTTCIFRKRWFDHVGGYDDSLTTGEDLDLYLKLAEHGELANLPDDLALVRRHLTSTTAISAPGAGTANKLRIVQAAYQRRGLNPDDVHIREFAYPSSEADLLLSWIETATVYGCKPAARKYVRRYLRQNWANPRNLWRLASLKAQPFTQRVKRVTRRALGKSPSAAAG